MRRLICLDYGDKNIGVALSDSLGLTAQALTAIHRDNENAVKPVLRQLAELISEYDVGKIILGYPRNMNGSEGFRCEKTREFKTRLEKRFNIEVILWDERLSTVGAERGLAYLTKQRRKSIIDTMAAVFILQGYLDYITKEKEKTIMSNYESNENEHGINENERGFSENENGINENEHGINENENGINENENGINENENGINENENGINENENGFDENEYDFDEDFEDAYESVTLINDDESESEYLIVDSLEDGGVSYFLLIAEEDEDNDTADAIILKEIKENGELVMRELEEDEFDRISKLFESGNDDYELEV